MSGGPSHIDMLDYKEQGQGDLDRQACGGTHLRSTGEARQARIVKIENKGRHNRRVRVAMEPA